jgi:hypothetical protein
MALESANYVNGLVSANPPSGDPVTQADDHLRLIKAALLATFPNLSGPVTGTPLQLNSWVPTGTIHLWYSTAASIPAGYAVCDGSTYAKADGSGNIVSPDLRDRFILGTGPLHAQGTTGGNSSVTPSTDPTTATGNIAVAAGGGVAAGSTGSTVLDITQIPSHTHLYSNATQTGVGGGGGSVQGPYNPASPNQATSSAGGGLGHVHTTPSVADHTHTGTFTGTAHNHTVTVPTVPPYLSLIYMIKL